MVHSAARKQQQNEADSSSQHSLHQVQSTAESSGSSPMQMPLQTPVSQISQQQYVQPVAPHQPMQSAQGYFVMPPNAMPVMQQPMPTPVFTSTPSGVADSAAQTTAMPIAPSYLTSQSAQIPQTPQVPQASYDPALPSFSPILLGTYTPKIDDKGRVALPAKFRAQLGKGFVMARGQERCIYVLPMVEFQRMTAQIQRTSMSNKSARDYLRVFLSGAVDEEADKQGRIVVPPMLRDYANLGDEIVVIGVGTRAEIWNKSAWEEYLADREQGYADIADDVLPAVM